MNSALALQGPRAINGINSHLGKLTRTYVIVWMIAQQTLTPFRVAGAAGCCELWAGPCDFCRCG